MKSATVKRFAAIAGLLVTATFAVAQQPPQNIDRYRHGNLAAAQNLIAQAYDRMTAAQQANEYELGGHAARAKQLLWQASEEIKQAAIEANQR
jgi:hypothetical protein